MKFAATLLVLVSLVASTTAHMALLYPVPRGGYGTPQYNGRVHTFIGYKDKTWTQKFPCGGYKPGPHVTDMKAGEIINVRFLASSMKADQIKNQPKPVSESRQFSQARHGGGTCEFSLSYDGGNTFRRIGLYTKTCPDAYYRWPVKIPKNVPSCINKKGEHKCLFVWSWTANILPQYYQNCADIRLTGERGGTLPPKTNAMHVKKVKTMPGDGKNHKSGGGPSSSQRKANTDDKL